MQKLVWIALGLGLVLPAAVHAEDLCISRLSVIEDDGITTLDASKLTGLSDLGHGSKSDSQKQPALDEGAKPEPKGPVIDYGDGNNNATSLPVERGDDGTRTGVVQYGDQELGKSDLVDYGDQKSTATGGPVVVRGDRAPIDLDANDSIDEKSSPFDALLGASLGGDAELARGLRLTPTQDGFTFGFENLILKVMQTPPPKSFRDLLEGVTRESGQAHVRMDLGSNKACVPAKWDGTRLRLETQKGNRLVMQFDKAKLVKKVSKKARKVFEFKGPLQLGIEKK